MRFCVWSWTVTYIRELYIDFILANVFGGVLLKASETRGAFAIEFRHVRVVSARTQCKSLSFKKNGKKTREQSMGINIYLNLSTILLRFLFSVNLTTTDYLNYLKLSC